MSIEPIVEMFGEDGQPGRKKHWKGSTRCRQDVILHEN